MNFFFRFFFFSISIQVGVVWCGVVWYPVADSKDVRRAPLNLSTT